MTTQRKISEARDSLLTSLLFRAESSIELTFLSLRKQILLRNWIAIVIANLAAWLFEESFANPSYNTLGIRITICLLGLPLVIATHSQLLPTIANYQKVYLFSFFTLLLPFMFGAIGLLNAVSTPDDQELSATWIFEYMAAIFLFYGLVSTERQALIVSVLAHLLLLIGILITKPSSYESALLFSAGMISAQFTVFGFATLTHRRLQFVHQQKLEAAYTIGSRVAHEIRTPLLTIKNLARALQAEVNEITRVPSSSDTKASIENRFLQIGQELTHANTTIDMLLMSSTGAPFSYSSEETVVLSDVVANAIQSYPYGNESEKARIRVTHRQNFSTKAPLRLLHHVLLNLLRNAILSVQPGVEPKIDIEISTNAGSGEVHVIDNGAGVPSELEHRLFENFFSTRKSGEGTGLGLAFCKSVMTEIGGDIEYSRGSDETRFTLTFRTDVVEIS